MLSQKKERNKMSYYEVGTKPEFDTLEIYVSLTNGQAEVLKRVEVKNLVEVEFNYLFWRNDGGSIKFLAPKLTEILTLIKGYDINKLEDWQQRSFKGNVTRTIKALETAVSEKWANVNNYYEQSIKRAREYADRFTTEYTPKLETGQYGFKIVAASDGYNNAGSVTIAPVPFISLDGTPTIEWVVDNEGFYLEWSGEDTPRRAKSDTRFGTLETAIEHAYTLVNVMIEEAVNEEKQERQKIREQLDGLVEIA